MCSLRGGPGDPIPVDLPPAAAFIDLDGTLLSVSSEKLFLGALHREGMLSFKRVLSFAAAYAVHPVRTASQGKGWNRTYLRGMDARRLREFASEFGAECLKPKLRPQVADLVRGLADKGWTTVLLTASLEPLAEAAAKGLPFSRIMASVPGETGGLLTGGLSAARPWGRAKVTLAESVCREMEIELEDCVAIGDSWADRYLLERCGHPVAVCPGGKLRRLAARHSWKVIEGSRTRWA